MATTLRFALCLLLAALLAPVHIADDGAKSKPDQPAAPALREFNAEELSAARKALADLTDEQRALLNHLRYLMRPQYEEELMSGRAFSPSPLTPFEQPGEALETPDVLRLWAALASGMPATESTKGWMALFLKSPLPSGDLNLAEYGLQMAVCAFGARRPELGLCDKLIDRAEKLADAAHKARRATGDKGPLIAGKGIDPKWYANQLWRGLICHFALELELNIIERGWETAVRNLLAAGDKAKGWRSSAGNNEANLFAIAALSLASTAPDRAMNGAVARDIDDWMRAAPALLKAADQDSVGAGTQLAVILSLVPELAPQGSDAVTWRKSLTQAAIDAHDPSGMVRDGAGQALGLADNRYSLRVCETALACVALGGGLTGRAAPLAGLSVTDIGRAMHACSVLHASNLPASARRVFTGHGHDLPEPHAIERYMLEGIEYLVNAQNKDGGWGSAWAATRGGQPGTRDPGTTAFVAMALMRAGHTPFSGEHKAAVLAATEYVLEVVEDAAEDGASITGITGTQLQGKLGKIVDTAVVTQFLARVLHATESDRALFARVEAALEKCVHKIESSQDEDGGWITSGWAPVLQSVMFNQALELAALAGCEVDADVLGLSRGYLARDVDAGEGHSVVKKADKAAASTSAGVAFYAGSSALRATAADAAEVSIVMDKAIKDGTLPARAKASAESLRKIGYKEAQATAKVTAYLQYENLLTKLEDESYLKGFGNNGGEEFISYMLSSESIVITGNETWTRWNDKMHGLFEKIQNGDGSWSGHHCISSPVLCTAAVLLCLTADREVHVIVETGPPGKTTAAKAASKPAKKSDGPVTGK